MSYDPSYPSYYPYPATIGEDLSPRPKGIRVGTGGTLVVMNEDGDTVEFTNVANGETLFVSPFRIVSSGTTASDIVALA